MIRVTGEDNAGDFPVGPFVLQFEGKIKAIGIRIHH